MEPSRVDAVIIGAGPVGLFAAFELGLFGIKCKLIDTMDRAGGQCAALYADKPIYDIPGMPSILAEDLVGQLLRQVAPFEPQFTFGRTATGLRRLDDGRLRVAIDDEAVDATVVVIAAGGGVFVPKPSLSEQPGGDGGYVMKPSPVASWDLTMHDDLILVDTEKFQTSVTGVFAIGDVAWYPGKLRLILSGFHEAALMAQAARRIVRPGERLPLQYTTSSSDLQKKLGVA